MNEYKFGELIDSLYSDSKGIILLDTCSLLDIIRVPKRQNINILIAGNQIIENTNHNFNVVLPSLIPSEWKDNVANVCDETQKELKKINSNMSFISTVFQSIGLESFNIFDVTQHDIEIRLKQLAETIIQNSWVLDSKDSEVEKIGLKALKRVIDKIPPSKQGKDSTKDCIVYEECLTIGESLRNIGFDKKIIFISSNTSEYDNDFIKNELQSHQINYASSLNWGVHEILKD
ncbi:PIN domain-containing protein [Sutcliffiella horikoshii]|uniref:PIN domain-containing protein n=1 Tax=Sutcliffiella horikoshii TaxID=79883 RepID=UPI003CF9E66B